MSGISKFTSSDSNLSVLVQILQLLQHKLFEPVFTPSAYTLKTIKTCFYVCTPRQTTNIKIWAIHKDHNLHVLVFNVSVGKHWSLGSLTRLVDYNYFIHAGYEVAESFFCYTTKIWRLMTVIKGGGHKVYKTVWQYAFQSTYHRCPCSGSVDTNFNHIE